MLFAELENLLNVAEEIVFSVTKSTNGLRLIVQTRLPKVIKTGDEREQKVRAALCAPLVIDSSSRELDAEFVNLLQEIVKERMTLKNRFRQTKDTTDELMVAASQSLAKSDGKPSKPKASEVIATGEPQTEKTETPKIGCSLI